MRRKGHWARGGKGREAEGAREKCLQGGEVMKNGGGRKE